MGIAFVRKHHEYADKSASSNTWNYSLTTAVPAGNLIVVWLGFDNTGTDTPTPMSAPYPSFTRATGETAQWQQLGFHDSSTSSGGTGVRGAICAIQTTVSWPAGTYSLYLSEPVTARTSIVAEFSGADIANVGPAFGATSTSGAPVANNITHVAGDLMLYLATAEMNTAWGADYTEPGGDGNAFTTGGGSASNVSLHAAYSITGGGTSNYAPNGGSGDSGCLHVRMRPAPTPVAATDSAGLTDSVQVGSLAYTFEATDTTGLTETAPSAPTVRSHQLVYVNNANSQVMVVPADTQPGDLILVVAHHGWDVNSVTPGTWTLADQQSGTNTNGGVFHKIAAPADAGASYTVNFYSTYYGNVAMLVIANHAGVREDDFLRSAGASGTAQVTSTTPRNQDLAVYYGGSRAASGAPTTNRGAYLDQRAADANAGARTASEVFTQDGSSTVTFTLSGSVLGYYLGTVVVARSESGGDRASATKSTLLDFTEQISSTDATTTTITISRTDAANPGDQVGLGDETQKVFAVSESTGLRDAESDQPLPERRDTLGLTDQAAASFVLPSTHDDPVGMTDVARIDGRLLTADGSSSGWTSVDVVIEDGAGRHGDPAFHLVTSPDHAYLNLGIGSGSTMVVGFAFKPPDNLDVSGTGYLMAFNTAAGASLLTAVLADLTGTVDFAVDGVTVLQLVTFVQPGWHYYEIAVGIDGAFGYVIARRDGVEIGRVENADTLGVNGSTIGQIYFGAHGNDTYLDDVYIQTGAEFAGDPVPAVLPPQVTGSLGRRRSSFDP